MNDHTTDVPVVALGDIEQCIMDLKHNKTAGYDGVVNEHLIFSDHHLRVHLSLLFTAMLRHSFVPDDLCKGIIVPLLKSKHGDATSLDMYRGRPITLSPVLSKVFEAVLLRIDKDYLISDQLQYGFKENSSCAHALFAVTEPIQHFTNRGSKVYCGFLDASKAFDKVLHNCIFLRNWWRKMFQLHLFGSCIIGTIIYVVLFVGIM